MGGFSLRWLLLLQSTGSRACGLRSCGTRAQQFWLPGFRAQAQYLWHSGLVALKHVESSQIRDRTHVSCISRWILYHWAPVKPLPTSNSLWIGQMLANKGICLFSSVNQNSPKRLCIAKVYPDMKQGTPWQPHSLPTETTRSRAFSQSDLPGRVPGAAWPCEPAGWSRHKTPHTRLGKYAWDVVWRWDSGQELGASRSMVSRGFPSGPLAKTWPSSAQGMGSIPGLGIKIPHAASPKTRT